MDNVKTCVCHGNRALMSQTREQIVFLTHTHVHLLCSSPIAGVCQMCIHTCIYFFDLAVKPLVMSISKFKLYTIMYTFFSKHQVEFESFGC